ncbi:MAG: SUMF1/EgtB/PvdO family nonheme iron enzyme [Planctomycetota bacterium]
MPLAGVLALASPAASQLAGAHFRNAGSNPASYTAVTPPVLGATYTATIDLGGTTGHNLAWLAGYATPFTFTLGGGQTLLINAGDPNGELLGQAFVPGPVATYDLSVPADPAFAGFEVATQALHWGGVQPWALSNAQDFILGLAPGAPGEMALVPGGECEMGDHHGEGNSDELPVHTVYIDPFWIDVYEVTNQKYADYLNTALAQGRITVSSSVVYQVGGAGQALCDTTGSSIWSRITWNGSTFGVTAGKEDHPMVRVSWYGACTYANQKSRDGGLTPCYDETSWACDFGAGGYRLPTEAEWEKAARGGEYTPYYRYPWGDSIDGSKANYSSSGDPYETGSTPWTTPVGYYDGSQVPPGVDMANGWGLYDMAGNVWEWSNDWYSYTYYSSSPYDNPTGPTTGMSRMVRGGGWAYDPWYLRSATRDNRYPVGRSYTVGIRVLAVGH